MSIFPVLTGWIATYALHSTILLGLALLISFRVGDQWNETFWKTALLGGLLTATLQAAVGYTPLAARWSIQDDRVPAVSAAAQLTRTVTGPPRRDPVSRSGDPAVEAERQTKHPTAPQGLAGAAVRDRGIPWTALLIGIWLAVAGLLLGRLALQHRWLFRILADRRRVTDGPLSGMLAVLRRHAGFWAPVRLTMSAACPTPIALGRSEICIPERFGTDLEPDQQRSALAHELAHLRRADPIWQLAAGIMESVFFFQPLNRVARRHLRSAAENLCDDWAVRHTGSPLELARCLTDIASWDSTPIPETTLAMAEGGSPLLRRIERLAEWREPPTHGIQFRSLAAIGLLAFVALVAPAVSQSASSPGSSALTAGGRPEEAGLPTAQRANLFQVVDSVIVHPDPSLPLADRWGWALAREHRSGFWIGWGVGGPGRAVSPGGSPLISSDGPNLGGDSRRARPLGAILAGSDALTPAVAFVFGVGETGKVEQIRLRSADAPVDLTGRPLIWLGPASTPASLAQLRHLYGSLEAPDLRAEVAAAFTLHEEQERVIRTVLEVLNEEEDPEVRAEAVQWLPRGQPGTVELVTALLTIAFEDPTEDVRLEAVDAIANLESEHARRALVSIVETHPEWPARSEAAQALERRHP